MGSGWGAIDPRYALVIDPPYQWHTFYGSGNDDYGRAIALDSTGNVYVAGTSTASWLGDRNTAPKHAHGGGKDLVVLKLNDKGVYQWHTFYGSAGNDEGQGLAVDGSGNVFVTGSSNAYWPGDKSKAPLHSYSGGSDLVVLKLNSAGAYQWHTFYGSTGSDEGRGLAVETDGEYLRHRHQPGYLEWGQRSGQRRSPSSPRRRHRRGHPGP